MKWKQNKKREYYFVIQRWTINKHFCFNFDSDSVYFSFNTLWMDWNCKFNVMAMYWMNEWIHLGHFFTWNGLLSDTVFGTFGDDDVIEPEFRYCCLIDLLISNVCVCVCVITFPLSKSSSFFLFVWITQYKYLWHYRFAFFSLSLALIDRIISYILAMNFQTIFFIIIIHSFIIRYMWLV